MTNREEIVYLFKKHFKKLCSFAYLLTRDKMLSEDAVQQVFLNLMENNLMKNIDSIDSYLYISTRNNALNLLEQQKTRNKYELNYSNVVKPEGNDIKPKMDQFSSLLNEAINSLPNQCRVIYEMKHVEGLSYKEISSYLELSQKTVENQIGIAFKKIRKYLLPYKRVIYNS